MSEQHVVDVPIYVALDVENRRQAFELLEKLGDACRYVKVGLELYLAEGPALVEALVARELSVFLDLKLFDIPNTVAGAVKSVASLGVDMLTIHTLGGATMLEAAAEAASSRALHALSGKPLRLLGVTLLTSVDDAGIRQMGLSDDPLSAHVLRLAGTAHDAALHGVVCSGHEVAMVKTRYPALSALVPGIRLGGESKDDQARVVTPGYAVAHGADYLVVGRPITRAPDPHEALLAFLQNLKGGSQDV
ncbi:orotidine-5'-phosphate decarboxylase [Ferroacidibacillus organovorans]|uniref:orotidine-5'-phosphate decarboxylase n=1 Tax=Ferroacidibacillus organovorans TaxID=1765683 RepID=UPI0009E9263E|nr:orotidine-5'-phosphate decarboxylase [Ferroacidibacillus organovorans]